MDPEREVPRLGDRSEPVRGLGRQDADVHGLDTRRRSGGIEACQPQHVVEQSPHPLGLVVDPPERGAIPAGLTLLGDGEARVRLDDRQRGSQFVRGVGGEFELSLAGDLDRRRHPPPDRHRAEEHDQQQDRRDEHLGQQDGRSGVVDAIDRLSDDDPAVAHFGAL